MVLYRKDHNYDTHIKRQNLSVFVASIQRPVFKVNTWRDNNNNQSKGERLRKPETGLYANKSFNFCLVEKNSCTERARGKREREADTSTE